MRRAIMTESRGVAKRPAPAAWWRGSMQGGCVRLKQLGDVPGVEPVLFAAILALQLDHALLCKNLPHFRLAETHQSVGGALARTTALEAQGSRLKKTHRILVEEAVQLRLVGQGELLLRGDGGGKGGELLPHVQGC